MKLMFCPTKNDQRIELTDAKFKILAEGDLGQSISVELPCGVYTLRSIGPGGVSKVSVAVDPPDGIFKSKIHCPM